MYTNTDLTDNTDLPAAALAWWQANIRSIRDIRVQKDFFYFFIFLVLVEINEKFKRIIC